MERLKIENRIAILKSRMRDNGNIIKKLERRLKKLECNKE
jgi:hypothetical protein